MDARISQNHECNNWIEIQEKVIKKGTYKEDLLEESRLRNKFKT